MNALRMTRAAAAIALALACSACIERFPRDGQSAPARPKIDRAALADVLVSQLPSDLVSIGASFGNAIDLVGYRLEPAQLIPGQFARVTFYWRCRAELGESWHVFVHLDDASGSGGRINKDHDPAMGRFPTDAWRPGDLIADPITFAAPQGALMLFLGFYTQGENRLQIVSPGRGRADGSNRLFAGVLPVVGATQPKP